MKTIRILSLLILALTPALLNAGAGYHHEVKSGFEIFKKADPIEKFWNWFLSNQQRLRKFEEGPNKYLNELIAEARKIRSGLTIELEPPKNGIINLTVSADGNTELFNLVEAITAKAPTIGGWKFIAFRQRLSLEQIRNMRLKVDGFELAPGDMKFFPVVEGDAIDIIIYIKGVTDENYKQVAYGGLLMLDNILGEYDCVTKVRSYDFHNMPEKKEDLQDLLPLLQIADYVDSFHRAKQPANNN